MSVTEIADIIEDNILFLDPSSTCTGWVAAKISSKREVTILGAGVLWFDDEWPAGKKYKYICDWVLNVAFVSYRVNTIVVEGYNTSFSMRNGSLVIPEMRGALQAACQDPHPPIDFFTLFPQQWRAALCIKQDKTAVGTKKWKLPTRKVIESLTKHTFPDKIKSNINGKLRTLPYDLFDAFGICLGWFHKGPGGVTSIKLEPNFLVGE